MTDGLRIPEPDHDRIRTKAMDPADLDALRKSFADRNSQSDGRIALEIAYRGGLRAREVARLHTDQIDIENAILRKIDGKGGKLRDVPIRRQDMEFFTTLKQQGGYVCRNSGHRNADGTGINRAIRDEMRRIGIAEKYEKTTIHAIRKLYARERMMELTGTDLRQDPRQNFKERKAWEIVQTELGHGSTLRMELYVRYVL